MPTGVDYGLVPQQARKETRLAEKIGVLMLQFFDGGQAVGVGTELQA